MFTPEFQDGHPRPYHPPDGLGPSDPRNDTVPAPAPADVKAVRPPTEAMPRRGPAARRALRRVLGALTLAGCVACFLRGAAPAADLLGSTALALLLPDLLDDRNSGGPRPPVT